MSVLLAKHLILSDSLLIHSEFDNSEIVYLLKRETYDGIFNFAWTGQIFFFQL